MWGIIFTLGELKCNTDTRGLVRSQDGSQDTESQLILIPPQILNIFEEARKTAAQRENVVLCPCCVLGVTEGYLNWVLVTALVGHPATYRV